MNTGLERAQNRLGMQAIVWSKLISVQVSSEGSKDIFEKLIIGLSEHIEQT